MQDRLESLAAQLRAMERELRRQRTVAALALTAAVGVGLASGWPASTVHARTRTPPAELMARRFVLVAADGVPLATLEATTDGTPRLTLSDRGGVARISLALAGDGSPSLVLGDAKGRERVRLGVEGDEARVSVTGMGASAVTLANGGVAPRLALTDAKGNDRLWLALRLGSPALQFLDAQGTARSGLATFNDEAGLAVMTGTDRSSPGLVLYGRDRTILWSAP